MPAQIGSLVVPEASFSALRLPRCPRYHELSELRHKEGCVLSFSSFIARITLTLSHLSTLGCYPNITADQFERAEKVIQKIKAEKLSFNTDEENEFLKVLRFLRARKFDVSSIIEATLVHIFDLLSPRSRLTMRWL